MTTNTEVSKSTQTIQTRSINRSVLLFFALALIVALLIIGIAGSFASPGAATLSASQEAMAERYQGLASFYSLSEPMSAQAASAWTSRYEELAHSLMINSAWSARYQGQAESVAVDKAFAARYQGLADAQPLSVSANIAWGDRYQGLVGLYNPSDPTHADDAWAARYTGLAGGK